MDLLRQLAGLMLPSQILDYFEVVKVEQSATLLDELYLDSYKCTDDIKTSAKSPYKIVQSEKKNGLDNFIRGFCRGFKVDDSGFKSFNVIAATLYEHYDEVLNFFVNRVTNAFTEFFNAIF